MAGNMVQQKEQNLTVLWLQFYSRSFFFFFKIFLCGPFLKSLLSLLQYCFCFMFWFFSHEACGILAPWPGIEPVPPALEGEVLNTGLPSKSPRSLFLSCVKKESYCRLVVILPIHCISSFPKLRVKFQPFITILKLIILPPLFDSQHITKSLITEKKK